MYYEPNEAFLMHYGVKGMKWGHRKARNPVYQQTVGAAKRNYKQANKAYSKSYNKAYNYSSRHMISQYTNKKRKAESDRRWADAANKATAANKAKQTYKAEKKAYKQTDEYKARQAKRAKALKTGAAVAGTALAAYGGYKAAKWVRQKNVDLGRDVAAKASKNYVDNKHVNIRSWGTNMDGTKSVSFVTNDLKRYGRLKYKNEDSAIKGYESISRYNDKITKESRKIYDDIVKRAYDEDFRTAAGNVYRHYRYKRR